MTPIFVQKLINVAVRGAKESFMCTSRVGNETKERQDTQAQNKALI